jgi:D-serine deaminase-like pyridoxal phosphate-dependent protein
LETPHIVIDAGIMANNINKMAQMVTNAGVKLRPHVKTHKMPSIALKQLQAGASGITVAKLSEAELMARHGIGDIFIAYPIVSPGKIDRLLQLASQIQLIAGVDSLESARLLAEAAVKSGKTIQVRLEIDTGMRRTGVLYRNAVEMAEQISLMPSLHLNGIYTYRGAMYDGKPTLDLKTAGDDEGKMMVELACRIRKRGIRIDEISVGSTPTARYAANVPGITEIRPGTYVFQDRMQARYGICGREDWAACVRVTVISRPSADLAIIDGGSKTFATDIQPMSNPLQLEGYGHVLGWEDIHFERVSEEHGMLKLGPVAQTSSLQAGDILHIVPNHICSTINLHNQVVIRYKNGEEHTAPVLARGLLE